MASDSESAAAIPRLMQTSVLQNTAKSEEYEGCLTMTIAFTDKEMEYLTFEKGRTIIADDCPPDIRATIEEKKAYIKAYYERHKEISKEREAIRVREAKAGSKSNCERNTKQ
jgi:hypothetical protein